MLGFLLSQIHEVWARKYAATLETRMSYSPSDVVAPLPFSNGYADELGEVARRVTDIRSSSCKEAQIGLTALYNHFHDPSEQSPSIQALRELH
jgi:hypothetical protein